MKSINFYIENPGQYIDDLVEASMDNSGVNHALFALDSHLHSQICDREEFHMLSEGDKIHWYTVITIKSVSHSLTLFKHPDYTPLSFHDIHDNLINRLVNIYKRNYALNGNVEFFKIIEKSIIDLITSLNDVMGDIYGYLGKTVNLTGSILIIFPSTILHLIKVMRFEYYPMMLPDILNYMGSDEAAMRTLVKSINKYKLTDGNSDVANYMLKLHAKNLEPFQNV